VDLPAGFSLIERNLVDSTNSEAARLIAGGAGHGTVVVAAAQTAGRGRRGRGWVSPPGNLYLSLIVELAAGRDPGQLAFVAALGAADALAPHGDVRLKWPNDVMLDGGKLAGILIEVENRLAVVGLGVNLVIAPEDGTRVPATTLAAAPPPDRLAAAFCNHFDRWYRRWVADGFAPVREYWLSRADGLGDPVEVRLPRETLTGRFAGLDEAGGLMLDRPDGARRIIAAGDVYFGNQ
jgi:BirA family transcriptional regulator, biotin operon repressor / biotin---[acetyl-CoA-carboxylase] ligase